MPMSRLAKALLPALPLVLVAAVPEIAGGPSYTADDKLVVPENYREWVFLSAGIDMNYSDTPGMTDGNMFDNVFVAPEAWQEFKRTGHWPDKTVFAREDRAGTTKGSINKHGLFQTEELKGLEFHVRDEQRFKGGWGFFIADSKSTATFVPYDRSCYGCHTTNGSVDSTFTQFYPIAKSIAVAAGTFRSE
jgi:hypothetical protein